MEKGKPGSRFGLILGTAVCLYAIWKVAGTLWEFRTTGGITTITDIDGRALTWGFVRYADQPLRVSVDLAIEAAFLAGACWLLWMMFTGRAKP